MTDPTYPHVPAKAGHCLWCGAESGFYLDILQGEKPRKWCSKYCTASAFAFRSTGRVSPRTKLPAPTHCQGCGEELVLGARRGNPKKWCSGSCRARHYRENSPGAVEREAERAKERNRKRAQERDLIDPRPQCENCGERLAKRREGIRFCKAKACQSAAYQARKESAPKCSEGCGRPVQARGLCGSHYSAKWRDKNKAKAHALRASYRARKRDAWVEDVDRAVVLERDEWICGICGQVIPRTSVYPDPLSPSMDHVVPLANGGEHSYENVQAAHFICNSVKQNREEGDQLALT